MWRNPKYFPPAEQAETEQHPEAPADTGERLATFPRDPGTELRVSRAEYQGRPFVSLRVWQRDQAGAWWPVKGKRCSVRIGECTALAEALHRVGASCASRAAPPRMKADGPAPPADPSDG